MGALMTVKAKFKLWPATFLKRISIYAFTDITVNQLKYHYANVILLLLKNTKSVFLFESFLNKVAFEEVPFVKILFDPNDFFPVDLVRLSRIFPILKESINRKKYNCDCQISSNS